MHNGRRRAGSPPGGDWMSLLLMIQVLIDTHNYQVFDGFYNEWSYEQHLDVSLSVHAPSKRRYSPYLNESSQHRASARNTEPTPSPRCTPSSASGRSPVPIAPSTSTVGVSARGTTVPTPGLPLSGRVMARAALATTSPRMSLPSYLPGLADLSR